MGPESGWLELPLWSFIGNAAQVASLGALGFAVYGLLRQRRQVRAVVWGFDLVGTSSVNGDEFHMAELYNAGTGTAVIATATFVGAQPLQTGDHRYQSVLGPGDRMSVLIASDRIEDAWLLVIWHSHDDGQLKRAQWFPVANPGSMRDLWDVSLAKTTPIRWWDRRGFRPRPVGPHHFAVSSFRAARREPISTKRFMTVWGAMSGVTAVYNWSPISTRPVKALPVPGWMPR